MQNKDVIYIETRSDTPFIAFGSRAVKNMVLSCGDFFVKDGALSFISDWNRGAILNSELEKLLDLISRVGFVEVKWIDVAGGQDYEDSFFSITETKALMEAWDD